MDLGLRSNLRPHMDPDPNKYYIWAWLDMQWSINASNSLVISLLQPSICGPPMRVETRINQPVNEYPSLDIDRRLAPIALAKESGAQPWLSTLRGLRGYIPIHWFYAVHPVGHLLSDSNGGPLPDFISALHFQSFIQQPRLDWLIMWVIYRTIAYQMWPIKSMVLIIIKMPIMQITRERERGAGGV